ncbi:MAG: YihY/virulence factor BrkB family protein [Nitrospirota bacterium]
MWSRINSGIVRLLWGKRLPARSRAGAFITELLQLLYVAVRDVYEGRLTLRATSLVYTTLLSLVPLIAVSFSVLKAFGVHNQLWPLLLRFFEPLGEKGVELSSRIIGFVENINVGVLGAVGLVFLVYTVISVIQQIEEAFNDIWKISRPRSFMRRFSDYLSVLLIGPVLVFSAMGITASVMSTSVVRWIVAFEPFGTVAYLASTIAPFILITAALTFFYSFIPNVKVHLRSALAGGIFAAVLWEASGWAYASFIASSARYSAIYSGFAIVILFMLWLYLNWLILLVGAEISFYHQHPQLLTPRKQLGLMSSRIKEALSLQVMILAGYNHYCNIPPWTRTSLMRHLGIPVAALADVLSILTQKRLLLETCDDPPLYLPARDIETITLKDIVTAVRTFGDDTVTSYGQRPVTAEADRIVREIDAAVSDTLEERTLKSVVLSCRDAHAGMRPGRMQTEELPVSS